MDKILFTSGPEYDKRKEINDKIVRMFFTEPTDRKFGLMCTGSGDPFASKIYRDMLSNIDGKKFPNLLERVGVISRTYFDYLIYLTKFSNYLKNKN